MCGRFYADESVLKGIWDVVRYVDQKLRLPKCGEIRPSDPALVILDGRKDVCVEAMNWGFLPPNGNSLVINARAESVFDRPMFRDSIVSCRCVIPSNHFYEWNSKKEKVMFRHPHGDILYLAGIYRMHETGNRFTILTTSANESMKPVHDRMPVLLDQEEAYSWICDDRFIKQALSREQMRLEREQEYEQQTFVFG